MSSSRTAALVAAATLVFSGIGPVSSASADGVNVTVSSSGVVNPAANRRASNGFDWSNPRGVRTAAVVPPATQRPQLRLSGRAAWVCSPAGFGRGSTCTAR